jgi:hypothetical protein
MTDARLEFILHFNTNTVLKKQGTAK